MARVGYCRHDVYTGEGNKCYRCEQEREQSIARETARIDEIRHIAREELLKIMDASLPPETPENPASKGDDTWVRIPETSKGASPSPNKTAAETNILGPAVPSGLEAGEEK